MSTCLLFNLGRYWLGARKKCALLGNEVVVIDTKMWLQRNTPMVVFVGHTVFLFHNFYG